MDYREYRTGSDIYREIVGSHYLKHYTVIITGRTGPTGKTTLCRLLVNAGVDAIDISENLNSYVQYSNDSRNAMIINDDNSSILVILNRSR